MAATSENTEIANLIIKSNPVNNATPEATTSVTERTVAREQNTGGNPWNQATNTSSSSISGDDILTDNSDVEVAAGEGEAEEGGFCLKLLKICCGDDGNNRNNADRNAGASV